MLFIRFSSEASAWMHPAAIVWFTLSRPICHEQIAAGLQIRVRKDLDGLIFLSLKRSHRVQQGSPVALLHYAGRWRWCKEVALPTQGDSLTIFLQVAATTEAIRRLRQMPDQIKGLPFPDVSQVHLATTTTGGHSKPWLPTKCDSTHPSVLSRKKLDERGMCVQLWRFPSHCVLIVAQAPRLSPLKHTLHTIALEFYDIRSAPVIFIVVVRVKRQYLSKEWKCSSTGVKLDHYDDHHHHLIKLMGPMNEFKGRTVCRLLLAALLGCSRAWNCIFYTVVSSKAEIIGIKEMNVAPLVR